MHMENLKSDLSRCFLYSLSFSIKIDYQNGGQSNRSETQPTQTTELFVKYEIYEKYWKYETNENEIYF